MKQKVTITDIAERANVSISTVSRVLNDRGIVTQEKRQAVQAAIEDLNYRPNLFARGLAGGASHTIGVVTQDISGPFYDAILRGIRQGLSTSNYFPIFVDGYWQIKQEKQAIQTLLSRQVDGMVVLGGAIPEEELVQLSHKLPLIVVGRNLPSLADHCIYLDDFAGAYKATEYLLELGHRRIAHITGILSHQDAVDRREGYLQALRDAGLTPDPDLIIEGDFMEQSGMLAVTMLLTQGRPFSAIFSANDQMALGARLALYRRNLRVPDDISLVGFDDQPSAAYMTPPLTTVRQPSMEIGKVAAETILDILDGESAYASVFPAELIIRESAARHR